MLLKLLNEAKINLFPYDSEIVKDHENYLQNKEKIVYLHRGVKIPKNTNLIFTFHIDKNNFLYVASPEGEEFIYYFPGSVEPEDFLENLGRHEDEHYYGVNISEKKYCFEIKVNVDGEIYLNFITTEPEGCGVGLNELFKVFFSLLTKINYKGRMALKDDVQVKGKFITYDRILAGKPSIYEKYGFFPNKRRMRQIEEEIKNKNFEAAKKLSRNIPMEGVFPG